MKRLRVSRKADRVNGHISSSNIKMSVPSLIFSFSETNYFRLLGHASPTRFCTEFGSLTDCRLYDLHAKHTRAKQTMPQVLDSLSTPKQLPQDTALFTSATIRASSLAANCFSANATGHIVPSSRFALSLKPSVAYLALNLAALWKKQTTLPSLA
jgi:hypothetical protein